MSKTDFTKVEEALIEGLDKMFKEKLLEEADRAQGKEVKREPQQDQLLKQIKKDLSILGKGNKKLLNSLKMSTEELEALLHLEGEVSQENKEKILLLKEKLTSLRKKKKKKKSDQELVEEEKKKHITKRFNVNDKWLPLQ